MRFDLLTIFPGYFSTPLSYGVLGKAIEKDLFRVGLHNLRDHSPDRRHQKVDDRPFGGGFGMVFMVEPIHRALQTIAREGKSRTILFSASGTPFTQQRSKELALYDQLILICPRYEGVDERVKGYIDEELCIGDYVLTGGEPAALIVMEAVCRHIPGVLGKEGSLQEESFETNLLDYPQYTQPREYLGAEVPEVLLSGDHEKIRLWRREQSLLKTRRVRPDLWTETLSDLEDET